MVVLYCLISEISLLIRNYGLSKCEHAFVSSLFNFDYQIETQSYESCGSLIYHQERLLMNLVNG
jgi:hypothetical protein